MLFCEQCTYSTQYWRREDLKMHIKKVHEKIFDEFCCHCDSSFSNMKDLRKHQKTAHNQTTASQELPLFRKRNDFYRIKCTECPYSTPHSSSLRNHLLKGHQLAICMNCSFRGNSFVELRNHCLEFHESMYNIDASKCHICKFSADSVQFSADFLSKTMIHIMAVHGGEHPCPTCNKNFKQKRHLKEHIDKYHMKKFDIVCEECNQAFWRRKNLDQHVRKYHRVKPDIICTECNKKLSSEGFLKLHMRRHEKARINGNEGNACWGCDKKFKGKGLLLNHINNAHLKIFDIYCQKCKKGFRWQSELEAHSRKYHSKTETFSCHVCNMMFSNGSCLKRHMKKKQHKKYKQSITKPFPTMEFKIGDDVISESSQDHQKDECSPNLRCPVVTCPLKFSDINEVNLHLGNDHDLQ